MTEASFELVATWLPFQFFTLVFNLVKEFKMLLYKLSIVLVFTASLSALAMPGDDPGRTRDGNIRPNDFTIWITSIEENQKNASALVDSVVNNQTDECTLSSADQNQASILLQCGTESKSWTSHWDGFFVSQELEVHTLSEMIKRGFSIVSIKTNNNPGRDFLLSRSKKESGSEIQPTKPNDVVGEETAKLANRLGRNQNTYVCSTYASGDKPGDIVFVFCDTGTSKYIIQNDRTTAQLVESGIINGLASSGFRRADTVLNKWSARITFLVRQTSHAR
ncbi:MAG: hypothetical protein ACXVA9_10750 [Bdellovibrionales bacterium]